MMFVYVILCQELYLVGKLFRLSTYHERVTNYKSERKLKY